ncbi:MAG: fructose 1,6-bisphosphatase [Flavobacteriaceae bacterium]|nr:fructose 1,6-bisphosphatase [Flavobacteriaceae bacterium]
MANEKNHKETPTKDVPVANNTKIDVIRELIFGENMTEYNAEFQALKKDLEKKRKELRKMMHEIREEMDQTIDSLSTDLNIRISDLESQLEEKSEDLLDRKVEKETLGAFLIELGEKIQKK